MSHPISVTTIGTCLLLGVAGSFGIPSTAHAATRTVTNCNDSGTGSLRQRAAIALSGDTIDCLLYTSPSPRDGLLSRMPSSA